MAGTATRKPKKQPKLRGGTSDKPPETPKIPTEANGKPDGPIAGAVDAVVNRVKGVKGPHVSEGDWRQQRKDDLKEVLQRRDAVIDDMDQLKEEFAAKKAEKKAVDAELVIAARNLDKEYPPRPAKLYPEPDEPKRNGKGKGKAEPSKNGQPEDEAWRSVPLASLGLSKGILDKLANPVDKKRGAVPPITTVGDITDFLAPKNGWEPRLVDLKGLGVEAVTKIDAALEQFWKERHASKAAAGAGGSNETSQPGTDANTQPTSADGSGSAGGAEVEAPKGDGPG